MHTIPISKLEQGRVPKRHWKVSIDQFKELSAKQRQRLRHWVACPESRDLLITGKPQSGKTSLAVLVLMSAAARFDRSIAYTDLRSLVEAHYNRNDEEHSEFYRHCMSADLLAIDDCASHKNEGCFLTLDFVYRSRHAANLPTIITCEEDETFAPVLSAEFGQKLAAKIISGSEHISLLSSEE